MLRRILRSPPARAPMHLGALLSAAALLGACHDDGGHNTSVGGTADGTMDGTADGPTTEPTDGGTETVDDTGLDDGGVEIEPAPGGLRRLVAREYISSIELMLGNEAAAAADPPADVAQEGFDAVGASILSLDPTAVEGYETSARAVAAAAVANPATLAQTAPCVTAPDASCYEQVATNLGRLMFRRPLEQVEIDMFVAVAQHGQDWGEGDFNAGLTYEIAAMLQCPSFLYLVEIGDEDAETGYRKLNPYELATRMSIFLLGRGPDAALLDEAEQGGLADGTAIRAKATELIDTAQAREALGGFFDEYFRLRSLASDAKNAETFPDFNSDLAAAMRQETQLLVHDIVWENDGDYREVFTADYTYVNDALANLYGIAPPGMGNTYVRTDWPANQMRSGYLSQASFLTHQSGPLRNSPTKRGRFIQQWVLCNEIPPPPPGVDPTLPDVGPDATLRETLLAHMDEESCASCHGFTDPMGFAFEYYDAIGAYRTVEANGQPLDASGSIDGFGEWSNAAELADLVAADPRTTLCLINNLIRGAIGHKETTGEIDAIIALDDAFAEGNYSMQNLMTEFTASPLFRLVDEPK